MLDVCLPGTGGTMPSRRRWLASAVLRHEGSVLLIDCGEGTQIAYKECGFMFKSIDVLCITHFHADHISGLPGMLLSMGNEGRVAPLDIVGPRGLDGVVDCLRVIAPELPFDVRTHEMARDGGAIKLGAYHITAFPTRHTVSSLGYSVELKRAGRFSVEAAKALGLPVQMWNKLQKNPTAEFEGKIYTQDMVLGAPRRGLKVTYVTDSRPSNEITAAAQGSDLLVCEGMYGDEEKLPRAREARHMMFREAAETALRAGAARLWLTHYSPSMPDPETYADACTSVFPGAVISRDGMCETLHFDDDGQPATINDNK